MSIDIPIPRRVGRERAAAIIEAWLASGQDEVTFCTEHDIAPQRFGRWRDDYAGGADQDGPAHMTTFERIDHHVPEVGASCWEIHCPGGILVRLPAVTDGRLVAEVVRSLGRMPC